MIVFKLDLRSKLNPIKQQQALYKLCISMSKQQKKPKPKSDQAPDLFQLLRQEHGNPQYMRYYLQQDHFTCHPLIINHQQSTLQQSTTTTLILKLFVNRIIFNAVSDVLINNKFVYNNSKIMNTAMESGRDMILGKYVKKHVNWQGFLNRKEFVMIKRAYESLTVQDQLRVQYSVISISNLILKLGINISKLSCILLQRKYTTAFLSIPTLSVVFLQYLMYKFFQSKQIDDKDQQAKSQFIRQLPRLTYIKLSEVINKAELMTMEIGQEVFFTSQTLRRVKNLQYMQLYQHEERDGIKGYENITNYEYIKAVNLRQSLGLQSPFGYQLLFLFRTIYFNVIKDFNPDVILFVQDYDSQHQIIQPEIRALILNELMQQVTGKVFVLREVGFRANFQYITSINSLALQDYQNYKQKKPTQGQIMQVYASQMQQQQSSQQPSMDHLQLMRKIHSDHHNNDNLHKKQHKTFLTSKQVQEMIMKRIEMLNIMTSQVQRRLDEEERLMMKRAEMDYQGLVVGSNNGINKRSGVVVVGGDFHTMQSILRQDLSYISLALIQQTPFTQLITRSHSHIYTQQFLKKIITCVSQLILDLKQSFQRKNDLINKLQLSRQQVSSMGENVKLPTYVMYKDYYDQVWDLRANRSYFLDVMGEEGQVVQRYRYYDKDYVKLYYGPFHSQQPHNQLLVFIFKTQTITLLKLVRFFNPIMNQQFYYWQAVIYQQNYPFQFFMSVDSTFVVTSENVYRAFGEVAGRNDKSHEYYYDHYHDCEEKARLELRVIRANYRHLITSNINSRNKVSLKVKNPKMLLHENHMQEEPSFPHLLKFEELTICRLERGNSKVEIELMQKTLGWGLFDEVSRDVVFMGGYAPRGGGENCVNKYLHVVNEKDTLIRQIGKTTNQIFMGYKHYKSKIPLFPFIYGIPFTLNKSCFILSTNGYFQNLTNNNKLFLTQFKLSHQLLDHKHGIISQRKLFVQYEKDEERLLAITAKDFIVHFIVNSYGYMNCDRGKCRLQSLDQGGLEIEVKVGVVVAGRQTVGIAVRTDRKEQHGFEEIMLYFSPIDIS